MVYARPIPENRSDMPSSRSRSQSLWHLWALKEIVSSPGEPSFFTTSVGTPNTRCACWLKQMQGTCITNFHQKWCIITYFANHWEWLACYKVINFPTYFSSLKPYQSVTNIFEYSNIWIYWSQIYIRTFICINFFFCEYIRTFVRVKFVCTNMFGHLLVSVLECKT